MKLNLFLFASLLTSSSAFMGIGAPKYVQAESLFQDADAQTGTKLDVAIEVEGGESVLAIRGMQIQLNTENANYEHPKMPGKNGPHPQLSSGIRSLDVTEAGSFISLKGQHEVDLKHGCWELIWREGAPAGSLVCGFDLEEDLTRNAATLNKGRVYLSFVVWTKSELAAQQMEKFRVEERAAKYQQERKDALLEMTQTNNLIMKALHYRNAAEAAEKHSFLDLGTAKKVPLDEDVIPIQNDLLIATKGLVWSKEGSFKKGQHTLLGSAVVLNANNVLAP